MSVLLLGAGKGRAGAAMAPITITSSATFSIPENSTAVATLTASGGTGSFTWTKIGGADTGKFTLTSGGVLTFATAPDFEVPTDANTDNVYLVQVQAADGVGTPATQNISVTVTDVAEVPNTWNPSDKSASVTLSNSDLTAATPGSSSNAGVRSVQRQTAGKFYFEATWTGVGGGNTGVGIGTSTAVLSSIGVSAAGAAIVFQSNGAIYFNGAYQSVAIGAIASVLCIAVDLTNQRFWARAGGAAWNGDPATNTGGINIAALFPSAAAYAIASFNDTVPTATINFGATAFAQPVPSGFSAWKDVSVP